MTSAAPVCRWFEKSPLVDWSRFCENPGMALKLPRLELLIGRSLAMCAHPYAAWRSQSAKGRALVLVAYMTVTYIIVLGVLMTL